MDYRAAFMTPFNHPKWWLNILLVAVCFLIPVVGPLVAFGYLARCKRAWHDGETYPEFDFTYFVEYLKNGLWPVLVMILLSLVATPFCLVYMMGSIAGVAFIADATSSGGNDFPFLAFVAAFVCLIGFVLLYMLVLLIMTPPYLKSEIEQDFAAGFSWAFFKDFIKRVGGTMVIAHIVLACTYFPLLLVGYIALFIGVYLTMAWWVFAASHIHFQLYQLYVSRGGAELTFSPKLVTVPDSVQQQGPPSPPATPDGMPPLPPQ